MVKDKGPGHRDESIPDNIPSKKEVIQKCFQDLASPDIALRMSTGQKVERIFRGENTSSITERFESDQTFALLGWFEYLLRSGRSVPLDVLEQTFKIALSMYEKKESLPKPGDNELAVTHEQDQKAFYDTLEPIIDAVDTSGNPDIQQHAYIFRARLLAGAGDYTGLSDHLESDKVKFSQSREAQNLFAETCVELGNLEAALTTYRSLQPYYQSQLIIEKQLRLLFQLDRQEEARSLYEFGRGITDYQGSVLKPLSYYRGTVESDDDLRELPESLMDMYSGQVISEYELDLIRSAEQYIYGEIENITQIFTLARERVENTYAEEFHYLRTRQLFLLEAGTLMLLLSQSPDEETPSIAEGYIELIQLLLFNIPYEGYRILRKHFDKQDYTWIERVRDIHMVETEEIKKGESFFVEGGKPQVYKELEERTIYQKISNNISYLYARIENENIDSHKLLSRLERLQNLLVLQDQNVGFFDSEGNVMAGKFLEQRLDTLEVHEFKIYSDISNYIVETYGYTVRQLIVYFSLNTSELDKMKLSFIRNDPKLLIFSLFVTLLGDQFISMSRINDFITEDAIENISQQEAYMLIRLLYREGYYIEILKFLINSPIFLAYPEFVEYLVLSLFRLLPEEIESYVEILDSEVFPDRFGVEGMQEHIDQIMENLSSKKNPRNKNILDRLFHAEMVYKCMTNPDESEIEIISLDPIENPISPLSASMNFSLFSFMPPPKSYEDTKVRMNYLESLYPYAGDDKREILQYLLAFSFQLKDIQSFNTYLNMSCADMIFIGKWKYAPYFMKGKEDEIEGIRLLAQDLSPGLIPEVLISRLHKISLSKNKSIGDEASFQLTFIFCRQNESMLEMLDAISNNFQAIFLLLNSHKGEDGSIHEDGAKKSISYFLAIGYEENVEDHDDEMIEAIPEYSSRLLAYLIEHLTQIRKMLTNVFRDNVEEINDDEDLQKNIKEKWLFALDEYERIFSLFPRESDARRGSITFIESFRKNAQKLFSEKAEDEIGEQSMRKIQFIPGKLEII